MSLETAALISETKRNQSLPKFSPDAFQSFIVEMMQWPLVPLRFSYGICDDTIAIYASILRVSRHP